MDILSMVKDYLEKTQDAFEEFVSVLRKKDNYSYCKRGDELSYGITGSYLNRVKHICGAISSKEGRFKEKKLLAISNMVVSNKISMGLEPHTYILPDTHNMVVKGKISNSTKDVIHEIVDYLYLNKGGTLEEFDLLMKKLFDTVKYTINDTTFFRKRTNTKIDFLLKSEGQVFVLESKTNERVQEGPARGELQAVIEYVALLLYSDLKDGKEVTYKTYRPIIVMTGFSSEQMKEVTHFPKMDVTQKHIGGAISIEDFCKYFFEFPYSIVEEGDSVYSNLTDKMFVETLMYNAGYFIENDILSGKDMSVALKKHIPKKVLQDALK